MPPFAVCFLFCCLQQVCRGQKFRKIREKILKKAAHHLKRQGVGQMFPPLAPSWWLWALLLLAAGLQGSNFFKNTRKSLKKANPNPKTLRRSPNVPPYCPAWCLWALLLLAAGPQGSKILNNTRKSLQKTNPAPKQPQRCPFLVLLGPFAACSRSAGVQNFTKYAKKFGKKQPSPQMDQPGARGFPKGRPWTVLGPFYCLQ